MNGALQEKIARRVATAIATVATAKKWGSFTPPAVVLTRPKKVEHGDFTTNVAFLLARSAHMAPPVIAELLAAQLTKDRELTALATVTALAGYLNFTLNETHSAALVQQILREGKKFGSTKVGAKQKVVVEYSQPNIAKSFSMGHLRSTVIGEAIARLLETQGYKVVRCNYLGDWGTHFGKLLYAYRTWGKQAKRQAARKKDPISYLRQLYVDFNTAAEKDPKLEDEARKLFRALEAGERTALKQQKEFLRLSFKEFEPIYKMLGITFDVMYSESQAAKKTEKVLKLLENRGLLQKSDGALVVDLKHDDLPTALLKKSDGATLYLTRDLAAAIERYEKVSATKKFSSLIYQVDLRQTLHFKQLFAVLRRMGYNWATTLELSRHGLYKLGGQVMASRKGRVIFLKEIFEAAVNRAEAIIFEKNPKLKNHKKVAQQVGLGAVRFNDLVSNKETDVEFSIEKAVNLQGKSGPYVQYTFARLQSILRKSNASITLLKRLKETDTTDKSKALLILLARYPEVLAEATQRRTPHTVAEFIYSVAQAANDFYNTVPVLKEEDKEKRSARLALVAATAQVLQNGLSVLGIEAPQQM